MVGQVLSVLIPESGSITYCLCQLLGLVVVLIFGGSFPERFYYHAVPNIFSGFLIVHGRSRSGLDHLRRYFPSIFGIRTDGCF